MIDDKKPMWPTIPTFDDYFPEYGKLSKEGQNKIEQLKTERDELLEALKGAAACLFTEGLCEEAKEYKALIAKRELTGDI